MFHEGDLQSGIALAIQQSKSVACFVRDDGPESSTWENDWLQQEEVSQVLTTKAVVLRLQAGSQEAGFLAAFCPVNQIPTLAVIHNGQLRETLVFGVSQEEFSLRLRNALGEEKIEHPQPHVIVPPPSTQSSVGTSSNNPNATIPTPVLPVPSQSVTQTPQTQALATSSRGAPPRQSQTPTTSPPTTTAQALRTERDLVNKAKGKQRAEPEQKPEQNQEPENTAPAISSSRGDWIAQQRQRQIEARSEKARILAQIEADKAERKNRQQEEKRMRLSQAQQSEPQSQVQSTPSRLSNAKTANLQVRLLDGGTVRSQFPAEATLAEDIRPWIDANLESKAPYTFKHILPPQPARAISVSEENSTLRDLGLLPSATLVLQPISNYAEAYSGGGDGLLALPHNLAIGAYGVVAGGIGAVTGTLGGAARWLRGGTFVEQTVENHDAAGQVLGQQSDESTIPQQPPPQQQQQSSTRIRTLADQRSERNEFYNGNSLDTTPSEDKRK